MKIKKNSFFILFLLFTFSLSIKLNDKKNKNNQNINQNEKNSIEKFNNQQEKNKSYYTGLLVIRIFILVSGIAILSYYVIRQFFWPNNDDNNEEYEILINNEKEIKKKIYLLKNDLKPIEFSNVNNNMNYIENCPICLDDFQSNSKIVLTPCNHIFHYLCFYTWVNNKSNNRNTKCPLCNNSLFKKSKLNNNLISNENTTQNTNSINI